MVMGLICHGPKLLFARKTHNLEILVLVSYFIMTVFNSLSWAEMVMGRIGQGPKWLFAEMTHNLKILVLVSYFIMDI